jgi:hypothetical protein
MFLGAGDGSLLGDALCCLRVGDPPPLSMLA